jgi:nucleoside-diphosphate-sugar epimerase
VNLAFGDGSNRLPLVYVDNVVDALMLAARSNTAYGRAYNIVDADEVTQRTYAERMGQALEARQSIYYLPLSTVRRLATGADLARAVLRGRRSPQGLFQRITRSLQSVRYDTSYAQKELAWQPRVNFEEALKRIRDAKFS